MFKNNKYTIWYYAIIESAKTKQHEKYEIHHIIPACLGGSDDSTNLIKLSYREHYIVHALLVKMHNSKKLLNAFWQMSFKNKIKYYNSHLYNIARGLYVASITGDNHWSKRDGYVGRSGPYSEEQLQNLNEKVGGDKHWTRKTDRHEHAAMMREHRDMEKHSALLRIRMLSADNPMKNPEVAAKFKHPKEIVTCTCCGKSGGKPVMMRYHFDKCRFR